MDRKIVIIPTYNEKENIENIIRAVLILSIILDTILKKLKAEPE